MGTHLIQCYCFLHADFEQVPENAPMKMKRSNPPSRNQPLKANRVGGERKGQKKRNSFDVGFLTTIADGGGTSESETEEPLNKRFRRCPKGLWDTCEVCSKGNCGKCDNCK